MRKCGWCDLPKVTLGQVATEMGHEMEPEEELTLRLARPGCFGLTPEAHSPTTSLILNICE